jgi:SAM-dependent methyltransferase
MQILGKPQEFNKLFATSIKSKVKINYKENFDFLEFIFLKCSESLNALDIGMGLRENFPKFKKQLGDLKTLDINEYENYPDIQVDLCQPVKLPEKYDLIFCFSILEHLYNPFKACENLENSLKKNGKVIGYAPFLYQFHCPADLSYQDFFRFSPHAYVALFPNASKIELYPVRGRLGTSLFILSSKWKYILEKKFPKIAIRLNNLGLSKNRLITSGYNFIISYE